MIGQVKPSHKAETSAAGSTTVMNSDSIAEEAEEESQTDNQQVG